jgi:lipopolysaccharide transport system permease protein
MRNYLEGIWQARYFYAYLARSELRYKFRRSKLGLLWAMVTPLVLALMMSLILGNILGVEMRDYAPYIFSGLLVWDFLMGSVIGGCHSLLGSEPYIKQFRHPFAIYPLKTTLVNISSFLIAITGLVLWILVYKPANLLVAVFALPISIVCLFLIGWPIATLTAFTNLKYRDFAQIATLGMQLLWYASPVFFQPSMFKTAKLALLLEFNPVTHILNLLRAPMLYGTFPSLVDYAFVLGTAAIFYLLAAYRIYKSEKALIYYF